MFDHISICALRPKNSGIDHHGAGRCIDKPSQIQNLFRLTGSQKMPRSFTPYFDPGVIVIAVRPAVRIYLPCRNSDTAQRIYRKYRLFSAASDPVSIHSLCRDGTVIRCLIGSFFGTPVICFQNRCFHLFSCNSLL